MEQEKDLLKKVLCEMLPYGVICNCVDPNFSGSVDWTLYAINLQDDTIGATNGEWNDEFAIENIKPYLRPISSMTEDEEREVNGLLSEVYDFTFRMDELLELIQMQKEIPFHYIDWLNAHHFDYCGLIPMGLALEAPEGMYKTKYV